MNQSNYLKSNIFESNNNLKHFFGNSDFIIPNNEKVFFLNQTHSDKVINIDNLKLSEVELNGDAIVTSKKDFYIGVKTADCVPILLGSTNSSFVAAVHSGWRGTFNKIIENDFNMRDFLTSTKYNWKNISLDPFQVIWLGAL